MQFQTAYGLNLVQKVNNKPLGYGVKVAIIVAYHYSNLQSDLNKFASKYSLVPISLNIINQAGNVSNSNWALEAGLQVQMLNTVSPGATVYVIEAKSESQKDVRTAIQTAQNLGVNVVSMPFGSVESASLDYGPPFAPIPGVVWIASSGDTRIPTFPATHPGVIAVGGTSAQLNTDNTLMSETAWEGAGAGMSIVATMPDFQMIPSVQKANTTGHRSIPDLAFHADANNGALVYSSVYGGYLVVGGTSVSTAFFTGVVAIADASRKAKGKPLLNSISGEGVLLQDSLYRLMSTYGGPTNSTVLNDVLHGTDGLYPAGPGYDIATGLGSLKVQKFIEYMDTQ
jgi:subtilase family serine protease